MKSDSYDLIADAYLNEREQVKNHSYLHQLNEKLKPSSTVLDIGCGAGVPIDSFLVKQGHLVWGIDSSTKQIDLARKLVPRAAFEVKDMTSLKPNEYSVDAVVCFYTLFHAPRTQHLELLKIFRSFLQPGGWLLITLGVTATEGEFPFHGATMQWSNYDAGTNKKLVAEAGFEINASEVDHANRERHLVILAKAA